jgi:hypothetical protein
MSKNRLSKERARRCNAMQQQLDKSSAMEDQLQEMIRGIEGMNYELADKVKSAKKDMHVARRLYEKSKESAKRYLVKLKIEKDEKARLKDELTRVLKVHQSQEDQLVAYKAMIERFKPSKCSLKLEVKIGCRGGARWPLWVTKVCCELLVNGLPPSAIPSSIGTLFTTLYGKEPKRIPSLNFICQCWVLVQIVSETITAMKLVFFPNRAEIFFDTTTCRQVPFSAVVISLMGDGPKTMDPFIVLSCVILEDKTSKTQVDGIVTKVRASSSHIFSMMLQMTHHFSPKINSLKKRLERLQQIVLSDYLQLYELMPSPDEIDTRPAQPHNDRLVQHRSEGKATPPVSDWWQHYQDGLPSSSV